MRKLWDNPLIVFRKLSPKSEKIYIYTWSHDCANAMWFYDCSLTHWDLLRVLSGVGGIVTSIVTLQRHFYGISLNFTLHSLLIWKHLRYSVPKLQDTLMQSWFIPEIMRKGLTFLYLQCGVVQLWFFFFWFYVRHLLVPRTAYISFSTRCPFQFVFVCGFKCCSHTPSLLPSALSNTGFVRINSPCWVAHQCFLPLNKGV